MRSKPATLVKALRILARDIQCEDGVATAVITEAADVIERGLLTPEELAVVDWAIEAADSLAECSGTGTGGKQSRESAVLRGLRFRCAR